MSRLILLFHKMRGMLRARMGIHDIIASFHSLATHQLKWSRMHNRRPCRELGLNYRSAARVAKLSLSDLEAVLLSSVFDRHFCVNAYPDIARAGVNPLLHYLEHGRFEQRKASKTFDPTLYLEANPDVANSGIEPFLHYVLIGQAANAHRSRDEIVCRELGLDLDGLNSEKLTASELVGGLRRSAEFTEVIEPLLEEIEHVFVTFKLRAPAPQEIVRSILHFYKANETTDRRWVVIRRGQIRRHLGIRPLKLEMDIVNQCNIRCTMCHFSNPELNTRKKQDISVENFARIGDQLFPLCSHVSLSFAAEPLLHRRIDEILRIVGQYEIPLISMYTNGLLLSEKVIAQLMQSKVHRLCISIDGATKDTYESIRVGGKFDKLITNIQALNAAKERLRSETPHICFNVTLMRSNIRELPSLIQLAHSLRVRAIAAVHMVPTKTASIDPKESLQWDKNLYDRMLDEAQALALKYEIGTSFPDRFVIDEPVPTPSLVETTHCDLRFVEPATKTPLGSTCLFPWHFVAIDSQGNVAPCGWWYNEAPMGNILADDFGAIWNNDAYCRLRSEHLSERPLRPTCQNCPAAGMGNNNSPSAFLVR